MRRGGPRRVQGTTTMRLLLVEDTNDVAEAIVASFARRGEAIDRVDSVEAAREALAVNDYEVIILDVVLPDGLGLEVVRGLRRERRSTPVLVLTARMAVEDRVAALDIGADDYLVKPFDLTELLARMRALLRRQAGRARDLIEIGALRLDPVAHVVQYRGQPVPLSAKEFALLHALVEAGNAVLSREQLEDRLYGWGEEVESNAVEVHVHNLRRKLSAQLIRTVRGVGYRLGETA